MGKNATQTAIGDSQIINERGCQHSPGNPDSPYAEIDTLVVLGRGYR